jgi:hypothetical protein
LLSILGFSFWAILRRGLKRRAIQIAVAVVFVYLSLNTMVLASAVLYLNAHPTVLASWWQSAMEGKGAASGVSAWSAGLAIAATSILAFPRVSLGLSGFELSMVVMPLIRGRQDDTPEKPRGRVQNARKLLVVSALIMAIYLLASSLVVTTLVPRDALVPNGSASNRALAYLAHGGALTTGETARALNPLFGEVFGTLYDVATIVILCLAGASVTLGLRDLVPQYMRRLGMELEWSHHTGAILHVFNLINLIITVVFRASVDAQRGAYATSVLVLVSTGAIGAALDRWTHAKGASARRTPWYYLAVSCLFLISAIAAVIANPAGVLIALGFVLVILLWSIVSRAVRSMELRCEEFEFADAESRFLWESLKYLEFPVLVPHRPGREPLEIKEQLIRERHRLTPEVPVVFAEITLGDTSEFYQKPLIRVIQEEGRFIIRVERCASISHVLAAVALELSKVGKPPEIHFGWSDESPVSANLNFLLFGRGNIPWMVRELIRKTEPNVERQPRVIVG